MLTGEVESHSLIIALDNSVQPVFDLGNWDKAADKNSNEWYCLTEGNAASNKTIKSVTIKVESLSFNDGTNTFVYAPTNGIDFTFTDIPVDLPTKLN